MPETPIDEELAYDDVAESSLADDQRRRAYYYDDACGYEVYDPDADDESADGEEVDES